MTTIHRAVTYTTDRHGHSVAAVEFDADELRGIAYALGSHDGGHDELLAIAARLEGNS